MHTLRPLPSHAVSPPAIVIRTAHHSQLITHALLVGRVLPLAARAVPAAVAVQVATRAAVAFVVVLAAVRGGHDVPQRVALVVFEELQPLWCPLVG